MACRQKDEKSSPEPILTTMSDVIWRHKVLHVMLVKCHESDSIQFVYLLQKLQIHNSIRLFITKNPNKYKRIHQNVARGNLKTL